jgi:hypothetical protein
MTFNTVDAVEEHLALLFAEDTSTILSVNFYYEKNIRLSLDLLTGRLYLQNSIDLISLEKLSAANLIGKGKLIEEILMEFYEQGEKN